MNNRIVIKKNIHLKNRHSGAVIIEFVLILPIFLLLLFAMIEIGWVMHTRQIMLSAVREGVRTLAIKGTSVKETEKYIKTYLERFGFSTPPMELKIKDQDPFCSKPFSEVSMTLSTPISSISIVGDPFNLFTKNKNIRVQYSMRKEC